MTTLTRRQKNIIRRMCDGDYFYSTDSPRITKREAVGLESLGFWLQSEHPLHEGKMYYPLNPDDFRQKATSLGIWNPDDSDTSG